MRTTIISAKGRFHNLPSFYVLLLPNMVTLKTQLPAHLSLANKMHPNRILCPRGTDLWGLHRLGAPAVVSVTSVKAEGQAKVG